VSAAYMHVRQVDTDVPLAANLFFSVSIPTVSSWRIRIAESRGSYCVLRTYVCFCLAGRRDVSLTMHAPSIWDAYVVLVELVLFLLIITYMVVIDTSRHAC
jgi:hypothetical protein